MSTKQKGEPPNKRRSDARGNRLAKSLWPDTETGATGSVTGYGRPPARTQFKPGKSGNPAGRPKASRNLKTIIRNALTSTVIRIVLRQLESALKGNEKAALVTLKMAGQVGLLDSADSAGEAPALSAAEQAIFDEIFARRIKKQRSKS